MSDGDHGLVAFAILVLATLLVIVAAVIALLRSRRTPGLTATSGRAIEEVAARMNGLIATARRVTMLPAAGVMLAGRPQRA